MRKTEAETIMREKKRIEKPQRHKGHKEFFPLCILCVFVVNIASFT
jgi:hypothetical protein